MNDPISWDPSLVKKFSSSNHSKLLNQLRNEVKKYPLNYKKKTSSIERKGQNLDSKIKSNLSQTEYSSLSKNSNVTNEVNSNKSTVSFNNASNFSIYNQTIKNISQHNDNLSHDQTQSNEDKSSPTFIERLNKIDMK